MRRLVVPLTVALVAVLSSTMANASCVALPGQRSDRLLQIAAGHVDADVAFIGKVIDRRDISRHGTTRQAVVFRVIATFAGAPLQKRTIFVGSACDNNGLCVESSEEQRYRGHRTQLVLADHQAGSGLVSQSICSETGGLSPSEVVLMLDQSQLPMTGFAAEAFAVGGSAAIVLGGLLTAVARRRHRYAQPTC